MLGGLKEDSPGWFIPLEKLPDDRLRRGLVFVFAAFFAFFSHRVLSMVFRGK